MKFSVRHVPAGATSVQRSSVDGASADEVRARLLADGSVVLEVQPGEYLRPVLVKGTAKFDVAWWCRELATLLRAGMTAVEAIETLAAGHQDGSRAPVHDALLASLRQGQSLSRAMAGCGAFPEVLIAGVTASERTSTLPEALDDYLRYDEMLERLRRQAASAAIYPSLVIGLGVAITIFLLVYVIPRFFRMYGDLHGPLSAGTEAVMALSAFMRAFGPWLGVGVIVALVAACWMWRQGLLTQLAVRAMNSVPVIRHQWDNFRRAKLYQSLALMFRGGYTFDEALQVCEGLNLGSQMTAGIAEARRSIAQGKPASTAMAGAGLTDVITERLLRVGERTGAFDQVLLTAAARYAQVFTTFVDRATRIVEPVLLLIVALVVGGIIVMMYMPIFDIAGGLGARS